MTIFSISNSGPPLVNSSRTFAFNIEAYISVSKTFDWLVGEGPLFWYVVESFPLETSCDGDPDKKISQTCITGCLPTNYLVQTVLASSVEHLCKRLKEELHWNHKIKRVRVWTRPALECDVDKFNANGIDTSCNKLIPVDFLGDECAIPSVEPDELPMIPKVAEVIKPGFKIANIQIMKPQTDAIHTKCGLLSSNLILKHNLAKSNFLKEFLSRNRLQLAEQIELVYSKTNNAWQKTLHLNGHNEKWNFVFEWFCMEGGWKSQTHISRQVGDAKQQNTRVLVNFSSHRDGQELVSLNYNTKTDKVTANASVIIKTKNIYDGIGLFRDNWNKDPYLILKITEKK